MTYTTQQTLNPVNSATERRKWERGLGLDAMNGATVNIITGETGVFIALIFPQAEPTRPSGKGRPDTPKKKWEAKK